MRVGLGFEDGGFEGVGVRVETIDLGNAAVGGADDQDGSVLEDAADEGLSRLGQHRVGRAFGGELAWVGVEAARLDLDDPVVIALGAGGIDRPCRAAGEGESGVGGGVGLGIHK